MVFIIKFVSDEVDGFVREIAISSEATFYDLHKMILASCGYSEGQLTSFFLCDSDWERRQEITLEDMGLSSAEEDAYVMSEVRLSDFIEEKGQKLEYVFDTFSNRSFFLNVKEVRLGEDLSVPQILRSVGDAPEEIRIDADETPIAAAGTAAAASLDDDFSEMYSWAFNEEDIDLEGFEISDELY